MTIRDLIDFYLSVQTPGQVMGFDSLYADDLEALKRKIQEAYGSHDEWIARDEDEPLPPELDAAARDLVEKFEAWQEDS